MNHAFRRGAAQHPLTIDRFDPETSRAADDILQILDVLRLVVSRSVDGEHAPPLTASPGAVFGSEIKYGDITGVGFQGDGWNFGSGNTPYILRTADLLLQALGIRVAKTMAAGNDPQRPRG